jgi:acyl-CoA thioester hydrolase
VATPNGRGKRDALGKSLRLLRWMLDAATDHTRAQGWPFARYAESGAGWVVRSHAIEYLRPAFAGETITLATWVAAMAKASSTRRYLYYRKADDSVLATAQTLWVFVNFRTGRLTRIPDEVMTAFAIVPSDEEVLADLRSGRPLE